MPTTFALLWAAAIMGVAALNIADVLPDWTTIAAVLTLPLLAVIRSRQCGAAQ